MSYRKRSQIEAHDAAGYETDFVNWNDHDDGYGNNVLHGDKSMQRMVEEGSREIRANRFEADPVITKAYDTEPFQSEPQRRKFFAMEARGEIPAGTARRYGKHK